MAMAGWKTNDMLNGIEGVMNLAAASGEDLASVSDIVTDAMTAFGLSADGTTKIIKDGFTKEVSNASHFADVLAAASANSNTNVSMLGESFKYVAPVAGSLGYSVEDTAIALGLMASSGLKSSMAGSSLRTILTNLAKPTDAVADAMDYLGISLQNSDGSMKSLGELTNDLRGAFGQCKMPLDEFNSQLADIQAKYESGELTEKKYTEAVEDLTGKAYGAEGALKAKYAATIAGKEGMAGLLAIVSAAPADYEKLTQSIYDCDGSAESMAETMNDNLEGQITILLSQLQELAISFGDLLMPTIREIVKHVQDFVDKLNSMDEGQKQTILRIGLVVAALGPALVSIGKVIEATATVSKGLGTVAAAFSKAGGFASVFSKAMGLISPPVALAVAAIGTIVAVIIHLWNTNEDFRNKVSEIWTKVKDSFVSMASNISEKLSGLSGAFSTAKELIGNIWDGLCSLLAPVILAAFNTIAIGLQNAFDLISGIFDLFANIFSGNWSGAWESAKGIVMTIFDTIKSYFSNIFTAIGDTVNVFLGWFGTSWQQLWNNVKTACLEAWENVKTACSQALAKISSVCSKAWNDLVKGVTDFGTNLYNIIKNAFESAKEFVSNTWDTIKNLTQVALMAVGEIIGAAVQIITLPFQFIWQNCKDIVIQKWNEIKSAVQSALSYIKDNIVTPLMNGIKTITSTVLNAIKTTTTTVLSAIRGAVLAAFSYIRDNIVTPIMNAVKTAITVSWNAIKSIVTQTVTAVRNAIQTAFSYIRDNIVTPVSNAVRTTVTNAWNSIRTATTNAWNAVKNAVQNGINGAKSAASSAANAIKSSVSSVWNSIKSATSSTWNAIKNAITGPINAAKNAVGNAIAAIRAKFNFSWSLPHLKLPHPSISGKFSLNPPSVPHFSIAWYKNGGIMTQPTVFGAAGNTILAGGEAGAEAILPLKQFYDRLGEMLDKKIEAMQTKTTVIVYVTLDGEIIAEKVVTRVEDEMADEVRKRR